MQETREISALLTLIDDPDHEVFSTVSNKIVDYGRGIIPNLENLWENSPSEDVQDRIEMLIHKLHYNDLTNDFTEWRNNPYHDLLFGSLLVAKFQYPNWLPRLYCKSLKELEEMYGLSLTAFLPHSNRQT